MNSSKPLDSIPPTDSVEITNGLTLTPRIKLRLTIHHADASVSPLDEWKLKRSLINFLKSSFSIPITIPEEDLIVRRFKDLKKRKREDAVAVASLFIRDLGFIVSAAEKIKGFDGGDGGLEEVLEKKFLEWRIVLVEKMDGMEVNLEGVKFRVSVNLPVSDDFEKMKKEWQEFYAFGPGSYSRGGKKEPDTIILRGLPSRWFAEPRVSSKPSMLVTHAIFSTFGKIRNLNVAEDNDPGTDTDADDEDLISGLQCKVVVQFDQYKEFYNALKVLCSRSLKKEGSRMKADCELTWDKDGFFQHARRYTQEGNSRIPTVGAGQYRNERRSSYNSRHSPDDE
ncbi:uncharacterized protein LOC110696611 isoform X1 [Chenopodium quinoa]|uniref:uncharacterized protein LOC110696611 isoform X1 n=1 Tax=Chenopodium quinoa TaxID=63459 RepID=UPI000B78B09E|nr:uncharacterized protein LOC110696611 isoform X1 [Chenopodium quinoa]